MVFTQCDSCANFKYKLVWPNARMRSACPRAWSVCYSYNRQWITVKKENVLIVVDRLKRSNIPEEQFRSTLQRQLTEFRRPRLWLSDSPKIPKKSDFRTISNTHKPTARMEFKIIFITCYSLPKENTLPPIFMFIRRQKISTFSQSKFWIVTIY